MVKIEKEKCISCLACVVACREGVIDFEGLFIYVTDVEKCRSCRQPQCKILCPTGAIIED
ncbi:MAG: ferredoxin [Thermoplasmata archaeon]|nr:MAG: ferredoxin [Thermoplasmata archaeon]